VEPGALPKLAAPVVLVTGYFDVLRAEHVRALNDLRAATLVTVVLPREDALLSQRARAELVAGLRAVDYVLMSEVAIAGARLVNFEEDDRRRERELREQVRQRTISK